MNTIELPGWNILWLVAGVVIAVRVVALAFRVLNRIVDRILPPAPVREKGDA